MLTDIATRWSLSSSTINIGQYGFSFNGGGECTGWQSGAGELDIHEILPGNEPSSIGYASLHMDGHYSGTPPQGFPRPDGSATMKMAVILSGSQLHIQVLDNSVNFDDTLDPATIDDWLSGNSSTPAGKGKFVAGGSPAYSADVPAASFDIILS